jgi:hypothetical protein
LFDDEILYTYVIYPNSQDFILPYTTFYNNDEYTWERALVQCLLVMKYTTLMKEERQNDSDYFLFVLFHIDDLPTFSKIEKIISKK